MKLRIFILIIMVLFLNLQSIAAEENEYGIVEAWFNGINASVETVNSAKLKIGEPIEIKITATSKTDGHVFVKLKEPGVTIAFDVVNGPSKEDERIDNLNIVKGWTKTFSWTITPNGEWKNGNAPINTLVQFYNSKTKESKIIQFTIANPYILDEQYSGAAITPKPTSSATETASSTPAKTAPFVPALVALSALILAWRWRREKS